MSGFPRGSYPVCESCSRVPVALLRLLSKGNLSGTKSVISGLALGIV